MIAVMEFTDVVRRRRMVRRYSPDPVDPAVVDRMLHNAVHAPSAGFSQGWGFLVLDRRPDVDRFWAATTPAGLGSGMSGWLSGMRTAPVVIVPFSSEALYRRRYAEPDKAPAGRRTTDEDQWPVPYWHVDAGMAALLILQTAVDEGVGACFFGVPASRTDTLRAEFGVPAHYTPVGAITVGHRPPGERPAGSAVTRRRRPVEEVVHRGAWTEPDASPVPDAGR
jgi:nitroreductase